MSRLTVRKSPMSQAVESVRSVLAHATENLTTASDGTQASEIRPEFSVSVEMPKLDLSQIPDEWTARLEERLESEIPSHWSKGALLNVRNRGDFYCITLYPEEYDPRYPERALMFPNTWTCQDFVSKWYARENPDPRAR